MHSGAAAARQRPRLSPGQSLRGFFCPAAAGFFKEMKNCLSTLQRVWFRHENTGEITLDKWGKIRYTGEAVKGKTLIGGGPCEAGRAGIVPVV